jgi:hypothetical protein
MTRVRLSPAGETCTMAQARAGVLPDEAICADAHESMGSTGMSNVVCGFVTGAALSVAAVGLGLGLSSAARAEGAIAIGASGDFAKDGFAFGAAINKASGDEAAEQALATCRKYEGAPKMAAICQVVFKFSHECYALSFDPDAGTPGVGWAIAGDKETAEDRALKNCQVTAGPNRRQFCKVNQSFCDGEN